MERNIACILIVNLSTQSVTRPQEPFCIWEGFTSRQKPTIITTTMNITKKVIIIVIITTITILKSECRFLLSIKTIPHIILHLPSSL